MSPIPEGLWIAPDAPAHRRLVNSLRVAIGDVDPDETQREFTDTELYLICVDAGDFLMALYDHGWGLARDRMEITSEGGAADRALLLLTAKTLIQMRTEREGTKNALLIREGEATIDTRTIGNTAQRARQELWQMLLTLVQQRNIGADLGLRIDSYGTPEWEP